MKRYLLLALALTACAMPAVTQTQPAPVVIVAPAPVVTLDASAVTVTLADSTLTIQLAPNVTGTWLRLTLPSGAQSGITDANACHCIGLGGAGAHVIEVSTPVGLSVYTSPSLDGPWTLAARAQ